MSAVLVIAGTDSSGGAGLTRDVHTLAQLRCEALCAVTAVTVQTDTRFADTHAVPAAVVSAQIAAALTNHAVGAVKIGMLTSAAVVRAVAAALEASSVPVVLDPVLASSSGGTLLGEEGRQALLECLLPRATLLTPNIPEAAALLSRPPAQEQKALLEQAQALLARGAAAVLLKGGHGSGAQATDYLVRAGHPPQLLRAPRAPRAVRGSGCALATAIAAGLAAGVDLGEACVRAKVYVTGRFQHSGEQRLSP